MKNLIKFTVIIFIIISNTGYSQDFQWAKGIRSPYPYDNDRGMGVDVDESGNLYVTGRYGNTLDFGNGITLTPINTANTTNDVFIAKYNSAGTCQWALRAGGSDHDVGYDIAYDVNGFLYITGIYSGTATFGSSSITSTGGYEVFVAKYSTAGVFQWVKSAGSTSTDYGIKVASDYNGNCFIMGEFYTTMDFGGGVTAVSYGSTDVFIAKYNSTGNILWARHGGSINHEEGSSLCVDNAGSAYITGTYHNIAATFGTFTLPTVSGNDVYLVKYNSAGTEVLVKNPGTTAGVRDAYVTADTPDNYYLQTIGSVSKYNSSGVVQWTRSCTGAAGLTGIKINKQGQIVACGLFSGTATFGSFSLTSSGGWDAYIAEYDICGNEIWATKCGGTQRDVPYDVSIDDNGYAYAIGEYQNTAAFGSFNLTSLGGNDAFITKIGSNQPNVTVTPNLTGYNTLASAFNAINSGVHGSAAISVFINNNTYETVTPTLNENVFTSCIITPTAAVTVSPYPCGPTLSALILLEGADKVTVDGNIAGTRSLTLKGEGKVTNCIKMQNGAKENLIKNIISENPTGVNIKISSPATTGNNSNRIENCIIKGGTKGISITGNSAFTNDDSKVFNNTVNDCSAGGIAIQEYTLNTQVIGNKIFNTDPLAPVSSSSFTAIGFYSNGNSAISPNSISQNKIYNMYFTNALTDITGIDINPAINTIATLDVNNNFISLSESFNNSLFIIGIKSNNISITEFTENIYFNSIYIGGTTTSTSCDSYGIYYTTSGSPTSTLKYNQKNNISVNERTGGFYNLASYIFYNAGMTFEADYNSYWTKGKIAFWNVDFFRNLPEYKCAAFPNEQNTLFKDVNFVDEVHGDLHLTGTSVQDFDLIGIPISGISGDFDLPTGRSTTAPYMGADEAAAFNFNGKIRVTAYIDGFKVPGVSPVNMTIEVWDSDGSVVYNQLAGSPYNVTLSSSGTATINCPAAVSPSHGKFHIVLKRPGCLDTWSKAGAETMSTITGQFLNYNFTSSPSQAFCSNMKTYGCKSYIFNGDIDGDGFIGIDDYTFVLNDAFPVSCFPLGTGGSTSAGVPTGGQPTDLTNDNPLYVDCSDVCLVDESVLWIPHLGNNPANLINRPSLDIGGTTYNSQCVNNPDVCTCPR